MIRVTLFSHRYHAYFNQINIYYIPKIIFFNHNIFLIFEILYQYKIDFVTVTSEIDFLLICYKSFYFHHTSILYIYIHVYIVRLSMKYQNCSITKRIESFDLF